MKNLLLIPLRHPVMTAGLLFLIMGIQYRAEIFGLEPEVVDLNSATETATTLETVAVDRGVSNNSVSSAVSSRESDPSSEPADTTYKFVDRSLETESSEATIEKNDSASLPVQLTSAPVVDSSATTPPNPALPAQEPLVVSEKEATEGNNKSNTPETNVGAVEAHSNSGQPQSTLPTLESASNAATELAPPAAPSIIEMPVDKALIQQPASDSTDANSTEKSVTLAETDMPVTPEFKSDEVPASGGHSPIKVETTNTPGQPSFATRLAYARSLNRQGQVPSALTAYEQLVTEFPEQLDARGEWADLLLRTRQWTPAMDQYEIVIQRLHSLGKGERAKQIIQIIGRFSPPMAYQLESRLAKANQPGKINN